MDALERPGGACLLCKPPLGTRSWQRAYSGHLTCELCEDKLDRALREIADRYEKLDPRPSGSQASDGTPRPPGFESRAPASEHIIAMMDPRSSEVARVWIAADRRVHQESERPPLSVYTMLLREVYEVAEQREMSLPDPCERVRHLTDWLLRHVEWITRQEAVVDFADVLRLLNRQLRPVTGDKPRRPLARCPNQVNETTCGGSLYGPASLSSSVIRCAACGGTWERGKPSTASDLDEWEFLGAMLGAEAA